MSETGREDLIVPGGAGLEGEPESNLTAREAQEWIRAYSSIVDFEEGILARMREMALAQADVVQREIRASNIQPMERLITQYRERIHRLEQRMISIQPEETAGS